MCQNLGTVMKLHTIMPETAMLEALVPDSDNSIEHLQVSLFR